MTRSRKLVTSVSTYLSDFLTTDANPFCLFTFLLASVGAARDDSISSTEFLINSVNSAPELGKNSESHYKSPGNDRAVIGPKGRVTAIFLKCRLCHNIIKSHNKFSLDITWEAAIVNNYTMPPPVITLSFGGCHTSHIRSQMVSTTGTNTGSTGPWSNFWRFTGTRFSDG